MKQFKFKEWIHSLNFVCFTKPTQPNTNVYLKNWERYRQRERVRERIVLKGKQEETIQDINGEEIKPTAKRTLTHTHNQQQIESTKYEKMARNKMQKSKKTWWIKHQQKENQTCLKGVEIKKHSTTTTIITHENTYRESVKVRERGIFWLDW